MGGSGWMGSEKRSLCENSNKKIWGGGGRVGVGSSVWGGQGGCEWRTEAFVKIQKKNICFLGGGVGFGRGIRVDGNGELKLL